jgi:hypothetical protein
MELAIVAAVVGVIAKPVINKLLPRIKTPFSLKHKKKLMEVYEALSKHRPLDFMLYPSYLGNNHEYQWVELDKYEGVKGNCLDLTPFLSDDGRKARIMMILLWIIVWALAGTEQSDRVVKGAICTGLKCSSTIVCYNSTVKKLMRLFKTDFLLDLATWIDAEAVPNFDGVIL